MIAFHHRFKGSVCPVSIVIMLALVGLLLPPTAVVMSRSTMEDDFLKQYKEKIAFTEFEIQKIQKNLEWLLAKIKNMEAAKRYVPLKMQKSVVLKNKEIETLIKKKKQLEHLLENKKKLKKPTAKYNLEYQLQKAGLMDWMDVSEHDKVLTLTNRLPILFASGSAEIAEEYKRFFADLANFLKPFDVSIIVNGYADETPIRTYKYPSNFELGAARAANIVHEFEKHGIQPSVCKIGSTGEHRLDSQKISKWKSFERYASIIILF